ncbi:MAG: PAS domain-containing sensor histidine kinase [Gemmatimonadota bacterium]|nr:PAS domain-containing sensor histidine kinase [Gemmatimonadota bacterium]
MSHPPDPPPSAPPPGGTDELVRLLIQNVQDYAIFLLSPDGRVVSWNEGAERISGYTEREVLGEPLAIFHPESARERGDPERELRVAQSAGRCEVEAWRVRKDGSLMWATVVITALHDSEGELVGFGTIIRDLSDRKRIARQYEESRQRYRSLFEYNPDAVFAFDFQGQLHSVNPAASLLCGYEVGELLQTSFLSLIAHGERSAAVECFRRAAAGEPQWLESALHHRDGHRVELSVAVVPILVHGEILGVYALAEDVTERKRGEEEREMLLVREREARGEAEAANLAKSDFLAVMSHELRTPLNAIMGYTDLVYEGDAGPLNETQHKHLGRVRASAARLLGLIEEILQFARTDPREDEAVNLEPVELTRLVREAAEAVAATAQERGIRLRLELPTPPVTLRTGGGKVRRILLNLLSNALKFTPQGEVRVFLEQGAGGVGIGVADTGVGILPEHHERIWEPFWQVEGGSTRSAEGAGLGLSLTRRLAQQLGGEISLRSAPGKGSTFVLRLPARTPT